MKVTSWAIKYVLNYLMVADELRNMLVIREHASNVDNWGIGQGLFSVNDFRSMGSFTSSENVQATLGCESVHHIFNRCV